MEQVLVKPGLDLLLEDQGIIQRDDKRFRAYIRAEDNPWSEHRLSPNRP